MHDLKKSNFRIIALISLFSVSFLSGCSSLKGPSGAKFDAVAVCNHSSGSSCSPTLGAKLPLTKQQIIMEVNRGSSGTPSKPTLTPKLETYLGTIVQRKVSLSGEPGTYCGDTGTSESVFNPSDFTERAVYRNDVAIEETFGRNSRVAFAADIKQALLEAKVPEKITNRLEAEIETEAEILAGRSSSTTGDFVEYRIKEKSLRRLEAARKDGQALNKDKACIDFLLNSGTEKKSDWRMYQSITGFNVRSNTVAGLSNSTLSVEFKAALQKEVDDAQNENGVLASELDNVSELLNENTSVSTSSSNTTVDEGAQGSKLTPEQLQSLVKQSCDASVTDKSLVGIDSCFRAVRNSSSTGASDPYFVVIGVSFWRSPRFSKIQ